MEKTKYIKTVTGKQFSKQYNVPVLEYGSIKPTKNPELFIINDVIQMTADKFVYITEEEYNEIMVSLIRHGDYVRKKNWSFFTQTKSPVMKVSHVKYVDNTVIINYCSYLPEHLVKLSQLEGLTLKSEWENYSISPLVESDLSKICVRESTGQPKVGYDDPKKALELCFVKNKQRPDANFEVYMCPHCNKYHLGKLPQGYRQRSINPASEISLGKVQRSILVEAENVKHPKESFWKRFFGWFRFFKN